MSIKREVLGGMTTESTEYITPCEGALCSQSLRFNVVIFVLSGVSQKETVPSAPLMSIFIARMTLLPMTTFAVRFLRT